MEWVRQWLLGVTAAAMLNALAQSMMPKGSVQRIGTLTGGLVLLLAVLQPIGGLDAGALREAFSPYLRDAELYGKVPETGQASFLKSIIEEECAAYIQDKAGEMGIECRVTVVCGGETGEYPYPEAVLVRGVADEERRARLTALIENDLGVAAEKQSYRTEGGEWD